MLSYSKTLASFINLNNMSVTDCCDCLQDKLNINIPVNSVVDTSQTYFKSGNMKLLQKDGVKAIYYHVAIEVVKNCFEHYAVISKDQKFKTRSTYLNLKNCVVVAVEDSNTQIRVLQNNYDGNYFIVETKDLQDRTEWINIMKNDPPPCSSCRIPLSPTLSPRIPRSPIMHSLTETEDEDEDD